MAVYQNDIAVVDLESGTLHRSFMNRTIGEGDNDANRYGVRLVRNGENVALDGVTCMGYFMRPDGNTVVIEGTVSGYDAFVVLPQACYVYEGNFTLAIKLMGTNIEGTMRIIDGTVANTTTDTQIDPGSVIPDISDLIEVIEEAEIAISDTVRYDIVQSRTTAEKLQARSNIEGQLDVGFYIDSSGYLCQKISSDT